jgi:serine/threonine-protein kinase
MHGRYTVLRKIADGGMAEIFLGTQHGAAGFERPVVLKRIRSAFVADPEFRNVLIDEAHIAMGLNHSNIVQVLDLGAARGLYFLVLELVDGWDLYQVLRRATIVSQPLPLPLGLHVAAEVCRALAFAHSRTASGRPLGIVHRDISPHNILVSQEGEVKLTDFGIATAGVKRERTADGMVKGKLGFMSPEQTAGAPIDVRSDLYSLGSTLFLMVTGRRPFEGATELETMLLNKEGRYPPPAELRADLPPAVAAVIDTAMQRSPEDRYPRADAMLADLERVLRTVLEPAGQTELKQWLAELTAKDGGQPATRAHLRPGAQTSLEGQALQLDEVALVDGVTPSQAVAPPAAGDATSPSRSVSRARSSARWPSRAFALGLGLVALIVGAAWGLGLRPLLEAKIASVRRPAVAAPAAATLARANGPLDLAPAPGLATAGEAAGEPPARRAGTEVAPAFLSQARGGEPVEAAAERAAQAPVDESPGKPEPVAVQIVSTPAGALVSVGAKVYGATPLHVRFRAELAYDLVVQKEGYEREVRRVYVTGRKGQVVSVALQKRRGFWPF